MGRLDGKVALITGAARGQGRAHALRLAEEGAEIIAIDLCAPVATAPYAMATLADLSETATLVEDLDRRVLARQTDVRDSAALADVVTEGIAEFGHIDILCANAGIASYARADKITDEVWQDLIDINLTGVWKSTRAVIPHMRERRQGSIIITSSAAGMVGVGDLAHYTAAKHGLVGLMKVLAIELAQHYVRVNTVHPTTVDTPMLDNPVALRQLGVRGVDEPSLEDARKVLKAINALPIPWVETVDVSNAVLFLASDEARYITGVQLPVEAGATMPFKFPNT